VSANGETAVLTTFEAVVTDIRLESRVSGRARWQIALDRTLFSAAAQTGVLEAVARSGARLEVPVLGVVEEDGVIWHFADKPLTEGTVITGRLAD
jgi:alanyl-tRNA synthetase